MKQKPALEIHVNGKKYCTPGFAGLDVLQAAVTLVTYRKSVDGQDFRFEVRGMTSSEKRPYHVKWIEHQVNVGDEITIRFIKAKKTTPPKKKYRAK
jgi:hypothetical protein